MTEEEMRVDAHLVISGRLGLPAVGFPHDHDAMDAVVMWGLKFLERANNPSERQRALFIRKLAVYIVRTGSKNYRCSYFGYGTAYFARKPETLETKLTFGGALKREFDSTAARMRRIDGPGRNTVCADLKKPLVEKPVLLVWRNYTLHQLVHAQHVLEAGMRVGNCLVHEVGDAVLPNPAYWQPIKKGERLLFALSHGADICALISIVSGLVTDLEFENNPRDISQVMPLVVDALQLKLGPLWPTSPGMRWPIPPAPPLPTPIDPNQLSFSFWGATP